MGEINSAKIFTAVNIYHKSFILYSVHSWPLYLCITFDEMPYDKTMFLHTKLTRIFMMIIRNLSFYDLHCCAGD